MDKSNKNKHDKNPILNENNCDFRQSLTPLQEAIANIQQQAIPVQETEELALKEALGRVLATTIQSSIDVPPVANSAMDGYAVRAEDLIENSNTLAISQRICAGEVGEALVANTAARIFTGAPIPLGANAVMMQENCEVQDESVVIKGQLSIGENVRDAGEDIQKGSIILNAGQKLRAQDIGLAASIGVPSLTVFRRFKVAVFFTGDELCDPSDEAKEGQIYNSNRYTLTGLLNSLGCDVIDLGNVEDTHEATVKALQTAANQADLVMTSGGVSVGEEDHIRNALEQVGQLNMWRVNVKPGKPFAFGHINDLNNSTPFIGLPGNPVSVFVTFCVFARPYIMQSQGINNTHAQSFKVPSDFELSGKESRNEYLRVRLDANETGDLVVHRYPNQSSGVLTSVSWANGLAFIPANTAVNRGDKVEFIPFSEF